MPLQAHDQSKLEQFFSDIAPFAVAYRSAVFRVFAVRAKSQFEIYLGLLELSAFSEGQALREFETDDIYCAGGDLQSSGLTARDIAKSLLSSSIDIGKRSFGFPADHGGNHSAHNWLFDGSAIDVRLAPGQLTISGANDRYVYVQQPALIRQLKASTKYYDGLRDLCADFGLRYENGMNPHFDICATRVGEILDSSSLDGSHIVINMRLAGALFTSEVALGLVITSKGGISARLHLRPEDISWTRESANDWLGSVEVNYADADAVVSKLNYAGSVQHSRKLVQPLHRINTLRFVHNLYDAKAEGLTGIITEPKVKQRDPQQLERAVGAILAMCGFVLASGLDSVPHLGEAPDILAVDTRGNLLVVECTLDLPKGDDKLTQASRKAIAIREHLNGHGRNDINVVAILATSRTTSDIERYVSEAQRQRVLLWSREFLLGLLQNESLPDADAFFDSLVSSQATWEFLGGQDIEDIN